MNVSIIRVGDGDNLDVAELSRLASAEGHAFVARARAEWDSGVNRFDAPGEGLFVALTASDVVGLCGLNADPFVEDPMIGRLRHLYVAPLWRRRGIGRSLVDTCLDLATGHFERVRLRTFDEGAARFYEAIGFRRIEEPDATHAITLRH